MSRRVSKVRSRFSSWLMASGMESSHRGFAGTVQLLSAGWPPGRPKAAWTGSRGRVPTTICASRPRSRTCAASASPSSSTRGTHDIRIDDFIEATASGQASEKRRRLDELTSVLQRGDRLVVSELSRLGRSLGQIVTILDALAKAGVAFIALKENIRVEGKRDIQTKVMTTLFALFAEVERDLISERTREGLARAGPRAGSSVARRGRWASHGSTARRTRSGAYVLLTPDASVPLAVSRALPLGHVRSAPLHRF